MKYNLHHDPQEFSREPQSQSGEHLVEWKTVCTSSASVHAHKKTRCTNGVQTKYPNTVSQHSIRICVRFNSKGVTVVIQKNWHSYADVTRGTRLLTHHIPSPMIIDCAAIEFRHRNVPLAVITVTTYSHCTLCSPR